MHQAVKRRVGARRVRIPSGSDHRPVGAEKNSECTLCTIVTQLRMQAESVPNLMEPHADDYGYSAIFKHYPQITAATKLIQIPAGQRCLDILDPIDNGGWSALEYTDTVLSHHSNEAPISDDQYQEYRRGFGY
jgi:hypothetical protein